MTTLLLGGMLASRNETQFAGHDGGRTQSEKTKVSHRQQLARKTGLCIPWYRKATIKNYLGDPFDHNTFLKSPNDDQLTNIMAAMQLAFQPIGQAKATARRARNEARRGQHPTRRQRKAQQAACSSDTSKVVAKPEEPAPKRAKKEVSTEPSLMAGLAVGLNQVTRALERDEAAIVVLCRSLKPQLLSQHIPVLCHQKQVPLCAVYDLAAKLGATLGCRRLTALAVCKPLKLLPSTDSTTTQEGTQPKLPAAGSTTPDYMALVEELRPAIPVLSIPWLEEASYKTLQVKQVLAVPKLAQRKQPPSA